MSVYQRAAVHVGDTVPDWTPDPGDDFVVFYCTTDNGLYFWDGVAWTKRDGSASWPVGAVYTTIDPTDPATTLGFGTWVQFATGTMLVGHDGGDADFATVETTGGEKTHQLTIAEMPAHTHAEEAPSSASGGAVKLGSDTNAGGTTPAGLSTDSTGGDAPHNNMPPFTVVYFWKRTA